MEMAIDICRKEFEDEQTLRKSKRKKVDEFLIIPDDILLDILKRLPESFLRYRAKYVCKRWLDLIISWVLLDHASFILQKMDDLTARYVGIREEGHGLQVKVHDLDIPHIGVIRSWGNEFLLTSDYKEGKKSLYVYNLITKEGSYLPECNASCGGYFTIKCAVALSFDGFKGIYKVVHLFMGPPIECHILILRSDIVSSEWKKIQVPCMNDGMFYSSNPVSVQGRYFHWDAYKYKHLVSIDMVKEEIVDMSLPNDDLTGFDYTIFEMGGSLALFAGDSTDKSVIWILKDFQKKKWEKLHSITLEKWSYRRYPVCGVMSMRYIILKCKDSMGMCYYDLKNGVVKKLDIDINDYDGCMIHLYP